jgi:hypothetical protein
MRDGVAAASDAGQFAALDVDAVTTALYGAIRDLGARVATAKRRRKAADEAIAVLDLILDGFTRIVVTGPTATRPTATRPTATRPAAARHNRLESA